MSLSPLSSMKMTNFVMPTPKPLSDAETARIHKTAQQFVGSFMSEMFGHMFSGVKVDPEFGGGHGEEVFRSMITQEYGKMMASSRNGTGLASSVEKKMIEIQQANQQDNSK